MPDPNDGMIAPYLIGSEWHDPTGLPLPPPPDPSVATITVTGPPAGQIVAAGSSVNLTFTPDPGTTIISILAGASDANGSIAMAWAGITSNAGNADGMDALRLPGLIEEVSLTVNTTDADGNRTETLVSYTGLGITAVNGSLVATLPIPPATIGNVKIGAMAGDTLGNPAGLNTSIWSQPTAAVQSLAIRLLNDKSKFSGVGQTTQLSLMATYSDGMSRDVTAAGTIYVSADPSVATVSSTGLITTVGAGTTQITCTHGEATNAVLVTVSLQVPSILSVEPLGAGAGQTFSLWLAATNLGGLTDIQFLTPAGMPDPNITVSGLSLSPETNSLFADVTIASSCPPGVDTIVLTAAGGYSYPSPSGNNRFTILPPSNTLTLSSSTAAGVQTLTGRLLLSAPFPDTNTAYRETVTLTSSDPSVSVPESMIAYAGQIFESFPITTSPVTAPVTVTISAVFRGTTATATLVVMPED